MACIFISKKCVLKWFKADLSVNNIVLGYAVRLPSNGLGGLYCNIRKIYQLLKGKEPKLFNILHKIFTISAIKYFHSLLMKYVFWSGIVGVKLVVIDTKIVKFTW